MRRLGVILVCGVTAAVLVAVVVASLAIQMTGQGMTRKSTMTALVWKSTSSTESKFAPSDISTFNEREQTFPNYAVASRNGRLFTIKGVIGESEIDFIVDTGAEIVCLTFEDAARMPNLKRNGLFPISMANGVTGSATDVVIPAIQVGQIVQRDVEGCVFPPAAPGDDSKSVLGLSFLKKIRKIDFGKGGETLILSQ